MILHGRKQIVRHSVIYLVRHGESSGNSSKIFKKPEDDNLTDKGRKQVDLLGECLAGEKITRIYSSDYPRAVETAHAIQLANLKSEFDLQVITEKRLRERRMGNFEGQRYEEVLSEIVKEKRPILDFEIPGGESMDEVADRVKRFFEELCDDIDRNKNPYLTETVVIISHSLVLIKLLELLTRPGQQYIAVNWNDAKHFKLIQNASFVKFTVEKLDKRSVSVPDGHIIRRRRRRLEFLEIHATEHLKPLTSTDKDTLVRFTESTNEAKRFSGCVHA